MLTGLAVAAWFAVLLARADEAFRKGTPEGVAEAVALTPSNTAYLSREALQAEYAGEDQSPLLKRIIQISPLASAPRIRLGLDAEIRGDTAQAERGLLDAAHVDHQYEPRWTLAQFYFRQQRMDDFWKWLHSALEVSYGDRRAAFELAWAAAPDTDAILAGAIPDQHDVLAAFLAYIEEKHADGAAAAVRLARWHNPADLPLLYFEMDDLLGRGDRNKARKIWLALGYPAPGVVFNPDFGPPHVDHGFDWRLETKPGVKFTQLETPPSLRITFDGRQPEVCELLRQYVGIRPGGKYVLSWESRGHANGIAWHAALGARPLKTSNDWTPGRMIFTATQDWIALSYERPLGEVRTEGSVELRHVAIEEQK